MIAKLVKSHFMMQDKIPLSLPSGMQLTALGLGKIKKSICGEQRILLNTG
jgi:hypothetical protein